jgi:CubicO group peptidase (beta-lactamase class C family)
MKPFTLLFVLVPMCVSAQTAKVPPRDMAKRIGNYVAPIVEDRDFGGAILVAQRGKILFKKAYGMANIGRAVRNTTNTEFGIGSISKEFTAAAILILEDEGKLKVDDPLSNFLPDFPKADQITLRMLLTHRSGILRDLPDGAHNMAIRRSATELAELIGVQPLTFDPGTKQSYSNMGFATLAFVIEKASGQSYGDFMREHIFKPLGMNHTGEMDEQDIDPLLAIGYRPWLGPLHLGPAQPHSASIGIGSGDLYSTVEDLYRWDRSFLGTTILSEKAKREMLDPKEGLGVDVENVFGQTLLTHNGVFWGYTGFVERYLKDDISIIYLGNIETGASVTTLETALRNIVFGQPYIAAVVPPEALATGDTHDLPGVYNVFPGLDLFVTRKGSELLLGAGDGYCPLEQRSDGKFFYRLKYATVEFVRDEGGLVKSLKWTERGNTFDCPRKS